MQLRRMPLFVFGLVYGMICGCVTAVVWGCVVAFHAIDAISGSRRLIVGVSDEFAIFLLIVIAVAVIAGFLFGLGYGLTRGTWHCAMDFYNNGFCAGLSSPFRYLHAEWLACSGRDSLSLRTYYASTRVGLLAMRETEVKAVVSHHVSTTATILSEVVRGSAGSINNDINSIILGYALDPRKITLHDEVGASIANKIEEFTVGAAVGGLPHHEQKASDALLNLGLNPKKEVDDAIKRHCFPSLARV